MYDGRNFQQMLVGIASFSPDYRPQSSCLDGHKVVHTQIAPYIPVIEQYISSQNAVSYF